MKNAATIPVRGQRVLLASGQMVVAQSFARKASTADARAAGGKCRFARWGNGYLVYKPCPPMPMAGIVDKLPAGAPPANNPAMRDAMA